jgi:hypothetical protein
MRVASETTTAMSTSRVSVFKIQKEAEQGPPVTPSKKLEA